MIEQLGRDRHAAAFEGGCERSVEILFEIAVELLDLAFGLCSVGTAEFGHEPPFGKIQERLVESVLAFAVSVTLYDDAF